MQVLQFGTDVDHERSLLWLARGRLGRVVLSQLALSEQVEHCHAYQQAVRDLIQNHRMLAVSHFGSQLNAAIDGAGREDQHVLFGFADAITVHTEEVRVLADGWEVRAALSFELDAQQVNDVGFREDFVEAVGNLDAQLGHVRRDQRRWSADDDARTKFFESPDVRSRDAAMQDVTD